ncbi:nucleoside permease [Rubinisphaera sp.]|uniref:nucleoside permease n=1 Tax=Rubinisphaera sp. TaxID=2024857 RepID=UPI000C1180B7|nr:nucleoside permease [Rubinisphaera sp.]MBV11481.1 MFS transporter [Rubinisphaera sp.]HCS52906.1 MFS transporter [Planctomycetaceae bacterium]|tara:strand:+ start:305 stop:1705 length:1401 start_codon:yes stop_codon:yes gene_type:complete
MSSKSPEAKAAAQAAIVTRLSAMMFIQFFVWGAWFTSLAACLITNGIGDAQGGAYGSAPIAAILAPLFLGLIADRFFASEFVMGVLMVLGGFFMCAVPHYTALGDSSTVVWLFTAHMICYMPTLGLSNTIAFSNIPSQNDFPKIRVWGTIGWIVAGLLVGFLGWSLSTNMFWLAGIASIIFGVYSFTLPHTPPPAKGQKVEFRTLLMLDALKLLSRPNFAVFIVCSTLICIPLAYYYGITSNYLTTVGFEQPASSMTLGQMSEIVFMLLIPFFLRHLGVKWMILIGMLAWVARYALFAVGAPDQVAWMIFLAIILHGICYDFFFVTGFIYTDQKAPKEIRGQAQSMLVFFTQGIGMYFGYWVAFARQGATVPSQQALQDAIKEARPEEVLSFGQKLTKMFSVDLPQVDPALVSETMAQWQAFWWVPAGMAAVIAVIFFAFFWDQEVEAAITEVTAEDEAGLSDIIQ